MASTPLGICFLDVTRMASKKPLVVLWSKVNFINKDINVCWVSTPVCLPRVKSSSECSRSCHKHRIYSDIDGAMLSTGDRV